MESSQNLIFLSVRKKDWEMNGKKGTSYIHSFMDANGEVMIFSSPKKFDAKTVFAENFEDIPLVKATFGQQKDDRGKYVLKLTGVEALD